MQGIRFRKIRLHKPHAAPACTSALFGKHTGDTVLPQYFLYRCFTQSLYLSLLLGHMIFRAQREPGH